MPKALKITKETLPHIVAEMKKVHFNGDYIESVREEAEEFGTFAYVITDGRWEWNNIIFTTFWEEDFFKIWKFAEDENGTEFQDVVKV